MADESRLARLRERMREVLSSLARLSTAMREMARIESQRPLTADEAARLAEQLAEQPAEQLT